MAAGTATAANPLQADEPAEFYVNEDSSTLEAAAELTGRDREIALYLSDFPTATWLEAEDPDAVEVQAREVVEAAAAAGQTPVLVAYNIPFRDCAQYSEGGATTEAEYQAWIDAVAEGIGDRDAVVILEPDGLGIIPWYTPLDGNPDWCQPEEADEETAAAERFAMMNYAVDTLKTNDDTAVYLDAGHSAWLNVGENAYRLIMGGVADADGFYLNASNYQFTENLTQYGTWLSKCITAALDSEDPAAFEYGDCANQYWVGGPANDFGADWPEGFSGALEHDAVWSDSAEEPQYNTAGINGVYEDWDADVHFVIDTSRNGQGPWTPPAEGFVPENPDADPEAWCNPPNRGLGEWPTTSTGNDLVDAYLWIKVPGESDGQCYRGTEGPQDPARGMIDPPAGAWFPEQAAELIRFSDPKAFYDVRIDSPYLAHISWLGNEGISTGWSDGSFRPDNSVARYQMAAFLYRMAGEPDFDVPIFSPFPDISTESPYFEAITWLWTEGIAEGYADGTFRPDNAVARDHMAAFLYRFANEDNTPERSPFADVRPNNAFYEEILWLADAGITTGWSDNTFRPREPVQRYQMAAFLYRMADGGLVAGDDVLIG